MQLIVSNYISSDIKYIIDNPTLMNYIQNYIFKLIYRQSAVMYSKNVRKNSSFN